MSWTKRQIVTQAFEEIGLANYVFDLKSDILQSALRRLDTMLATWNQLGIRVSYPLYSDPTESDLDENSGIPDKVIEATILGLACRIAPIFGKQVSKETKQFARSAYRALLNSYSKPLEMQLPKETPAGAGNKPWRYYNDPFVDAPSDDVAVGDDSELELY